MKKSIKVAILEDLKPGTNIRLKDGTVEYKFIMLSGDSVKLEHSKINYRPKKRELELDLKNKVNALYYDLANYKELTKNMKIETLISNLVTVTNS